MHEDSVLKLLHKQLTDQLDATDRKLLIDWLAHSTKNEEEKKDVSQVWELSGNYTPPFTPDVDKSFERFSERLKAEIPVESPPKVIPLNPIRNWMKYAAVAAVLVGVFAVWQVTQTYKVDYTTIATISDEVKVIDLADGSKVWVDEKSTITYPNKFIGNERAIQLEGHAYLEVADDSKKPFIVDGEEVDVRVLGTSFSVLTNKEASQLVVEVKEGTVEVVPEGSSDIRSVTKKERMVYDIKEKAYLEKELLSVSNADFFVTNTYRFIESKFSFVFQILENVYDAEFDFEEEYLKDCELTSPIEFDRSDLRTALDIIEATNKNSALSIEKIGAKNYLIKGDPCK